jgi:hypothetical protein
LPRPGVWSPKGSSRHAGRCTRYTSTHRRSTRDWPSSAPPTRVATGHKSTSR